MINRKQERAYTDWLISQPCAWPGCGHRAEHLYHEPPVGIGRNKKKISLIGAVVPLCLEHHDIRHNRQSFKPKTNEADGDILRQLRYLARIYYPSEFEMNEKVSGGCGVTDRNDTPICHSNSVWFKFCPFCGREIKSEYNGMRWEWWEEGETLESKLDKLLNVRSQDE